MMSNSFVASRYLMSYFLNTEVYPEYELNDLYKTSDVGSRHIFNRAVDLLLKDGFIEYFNNSVFDGVWVRRSLPKRKRLTNMNKLVGYVVDDYQTFIGCKKDGLLQAQADFVAANNLRRLEWQQKHKRKTGEKQ
jgi:hypothetical protein